jgi:alkylation response protein AidB-like acyl-CoA dehydrogenase
MASPDWQRDEKIVGHNCQALQKGAAMEFEHSDKVRKLQERVAAFMAEHIYPNEEELFAEVNEGDRWQPVSLLEGLKAKARAAELWNLFLPESEYGAGLTNLEHAPLCEIMGRSPWAPEVFNCSAPDTGNMEVLVRYGTPEQRVARRRNPLGLCDDGARCSFIGCHQYRHAHPARCQ